MRWSWAHHQLMLTGREGRADPGTDRAREIRRVLRHAGEVTTVAEFLRARREQLTPADVGLPDSGRRRTPGLRREEVATLAGVSVDYLIRLEQGRDQRPSAAILSAIGNALLLGADEMTHLNKIGMLSANSELCPPPRLMPTEVGATVLTMLDSLAPMPAFVLGPANDVLAANGS